MASEMKTTTDHEEIRCWVRPACCVLTSPGVRGKTGWRAHRWDRWLEYFDQNDLAFVYQQRKADGEESTFFKLVRRD